MDFFFSLTVPTEPGVASLLHLFLSRYFPIPYTSSGLFWCFSKKIYATRSALFLDLTRCRIVVYYRRFGTTYQSHFKGQSVQKFFFWTARQSIMLPIGFPETSVANYQSILRNISEDFWSHWHRGGSLKLCKRYDELTRRNKKFWPVAPCIVRESLHSICL